MLNNKKKTPKAYEIHEIGGTAEQEAFMNDIIDQFTIDSSQLVEIRDHFIQEMEKGLNQEGATLAMIPSYVEGRLTGKYEQMIVKLYLTSWSGKEEGRFLALDLGGTNLRVVLVTLEGDGKFQTVSTKSKVSEELKTGPMRNLCGMIIVTSIKKHS